MVVCGSVWVRGEGASGREGKMKGDDGTKVPGAKRRVAVAMARALSIVGWRIGLGVGVGAAA